MGVRQIVRVGAAALAFLAVVAFNGDVQAQSAQHLRQQVLDMSYLPDDQRGARRQQLISQVRAQLRTVPARSAQWAALQVTLGFALMGAGDEVEELTSNMSAARVAADNALQVLTRASAPADWGHAHFIRMATVWGSLAAGDLGEDFDYEAVRTQALASEQAALSVFTVEAYPQEYLAVRCYADMVLRDLVQPREDTDQAGFMGHMVSKMPLIATCGGLASGRSGGFGNARQMMLQSTLGMITYGAEGNAVGETMMMMGRHRAVALNATLTLEQLGLTPAQLQRARALRAQADEVASRAPDHSAQGLRDNLEFWRPTAGLYEILREASPEAAAAPPQLRDPFLAPMIVDQNLGLVVVRVPTGQGGYEGVAGQDLQALLAHVQSNQIGQGVTVWTNAFRAASAVTDDVQRAAQMQRAIDEFRTRFTPGWLPLMRKVAQAAGVRRGGRMVIMTDGVSSALPLGLLGEGAGSLIEEYELVYTPSPTAYETSLRRMQRQQGRTLAAVYVPGGDLGSASAEVHAARHALGAASTAPPPNGRANVVAALRNASYWHFATHGAFETQQPRLSWLDVGGGERLTLSNLYFAPQSLGEPRLVVLSACESGISDTRFSPDDFIGLPAGFLQAGAASVIAAMWKVPDAASALLMARFYELHGRENQPPSQALRNAQLWLKNSTRQQLEAYVQGLETRGAISAADSEPLLGYLSETQAERPFAQPYYWGAWVYYGA